MLRSVTSRLWIGCLFSSGFGLWSGALMLAIAHAGLVDAPATAQSSLLPADQEVHFNPPPLPHDFDRSELNRSELNRSASCPADSDSTLATLVALGPPTGLGLTHRATPKLYVYLKDPSALAPISSVRLSHQEGSRVWETAVTLPSQPGLVEIDWPQADGAAPSSSATPSSNSGSVTQQRSNPDAAVDLQPNQRYFWSFAATCRSDGNTVTVGSWIERVEPHPSLEQALDNAAEPEQAIFYSQYGLWYDALAIAAQLKREGDASAWQSLLSRPEFTDGIAQGSFVAP